MINEKRLPIIDNAEEERCWHLVSQIESVVNQLEIDFAKIRDDLHTELMYSEEDLRFYRNLNSKIRTRKADHGTDVQRRRP
jgi:hypothetical protein